MMDKKISCFFLRWWRGKNKIRDNLCKHINVKQYNISVYRFPRKKSSYDDDFSPSLLLSKKGKIYFRKVT